MPLPREAIEGVEALRGRLLGKGSEQDQIGMVGKELTVGAPQQATNPRDPGIQFARPHRDQSQRLSGDRSEDPRRHRFGTAGIEMPLFLADRCEFEKPPESGQDAPPGVVGHRPAAERDGDGACDRFQRPLASRERGRGDRRGQLLDVDRERTRSAGGQEVAPTTLRAQHFELELASEFQQSPTERRFDEANGGTLTLRTGAARRSPTRLDSSACRPVESRQQRLDRLGGLAGMPQKALSDPADDLAPVHRRHVGAVDRFGGVPSHRHDATGRGARLERPAGDRTRLAARCQTWSVPKPAGSRPDRTCRRLRPHDSPAEASGRGLASNQR
jgi:hypothetical protein